MATIREIVGRVSGERQTSGRFPARLVYAQNFSDYVKLVDELDKVCDITLNLADFAKSDILPNFKALRQELDKHPDKQILLLSLGEYLRLCPKRETDKGSSEFLSIWETIQPTSWTRKFIMPIFGGPELLGQVISQLNERQRDFLWELTESENYSEYTVTVYAAPAFVESIQADASHFQEWLEKWTALFGDATRRSFSLTTKLHKYACAAYGNVKVEVVSEPFAYIDEIPLSVPKPPETKESKAATINSMRI